ncbi:MAG: hypothetical protein DBX59_05005 [Bacillota bacterium]|nr:MAG: hypothetical protein DBX59_05005 [Bacillota bacterium]
MFLLETAGSLDKIFSESGVSIPENKGLTMKNERYNFQVAAFSRWETKLGCKLKFTTELLPYITVRNVEYAKGTFNLAEEHDDGYIFLCDDVRPYPDVLTPVDSLGLTLRPNMWTVFYITVDNVKITGDFPILITLTDENDNKLAKTEYSLRIIDRELPQNNIFITQWIYPDCVCNVHKVEPFSFAFYKIYNEYLRTYILHGGNTLYTPLFTPPLNTEIGGERLTTQLIDVELKNGEYKFDFQKLDRFIDNAIEMGIVNFEFSHFATQWGAEFCPKIIAKKGNSTIRIFGWDTKSDSAEYLQFLKVFLPALKNYLKNKKQIEKCFFHISDEPHAEHKEKYQTIKEILKNELSEYEFLDALSNYDFYRQKLIDIPVVAINHYPEFKDNCKNLWVYYCMEQTSENLTNRFLDMPLIRLRILGIQLYFNGIQGFLHWGFNFYNNYNSTKSINPYYITDAGGVFPSGDSFIVYPGKESVLDSIRLETFGEAIKDYRLLLLLEKKYSREFVMQFLKEKGFYGFTVYPSNPTVFKEIINTLHEMTEKI